MKKIKLIFGIIFVALVAMGAKISDDTLRVGPKTGTDITIEMGDGRLKFDDAANKLRFSNDLGSSFKDIGSGGGGAAGVNLIGDSNPDFESGDPPSSWSASGGAFVANVGEGFDTQAGSFDASAASQNLDSVLKAVPLGLENRSCNATIQYKYAAGSSGDYKLQAVANTAGLLAEIDLDVTTDWAKKAIQFSCPSSDSVRVRITSTADGGVLLVDNATIGRSDFTDLTDTLDSKLTMGGTTETKVKWGSARVTCSGSSSIQDQSGTWLASVSNISSGDCTFTLSEGAVSRIIGCVAMESASLGPTHIYSQANFVPGSGTLDIGCKNADGGVDCTSSPMQVTCAWVSL